MKTRSLSDLVADVRFLADIEALTVRYTTAAIERLVNEGFQAYLELIGGNAGRVMRTLNGGDVTAGSDYISYSGAARVRGIALIGDDGEWYELEESTPSRMVEFYSVRRDSDGTAITGEPTVTSGLPQYWWLEVQQVDAGATTAATGTASIRIWPPTDRTRASHILYEPDAPTLVEVNGKVPQSQAYFPIPRGDEYVVAYAALKVAIRDADQDKMAAVGALLEKLEKDIRAKKRSFSGGTAGRRDTRTERRFEFFRRGSRV